MAAAKPAMSPTTPPPSATSTLRRSACAAASASITSDAAARSLPASLAGNTKCSVRATAPRERATRSRYSAATVGSVTMRIDVGRSGASHSPSRSTRPEPTWMRYSRPARATGTWITASAEDSGAFIGVILRTRSQRLQFRAFEDPAHELFRTRHRRVKRQVRGFGIERCTLCQQRDDTSAGIGRLQQRPRLVVAGAAGDFVGAGLQVDDETARTQIAAIVLAQDRAPAGRDDEPATLREFIEQRAFATPKAVLALDLEDRGDRDAAARLDLAIGIDEREGERTREQASDGRLACAHHSDEKQRSGFGFHEPKVTGVA